METYQRRIRSFVLRQGHLSIAQQKARQAGLLVWGIPYAKKPLELSQVFGRTAPTILEIGFGMGQATATIAAAHPHYNYLGVEVHTPGVGSLCQLIEAQKIANIRIIQHDVVDVLENMLPPASLEGIHIFFPDPWHKKRHHKRRLIQPLFVQLLVSRLKPGGYLHLATDWENYAQQMLSVLGDNPALSNTAIDFSPKPDYRPLTKFEQRGLNLGHGIWDIIFKRL
jgi:tRNA (guanine-N7-)-methyltransferase